MPAPKRCLHIISKSCLSATHYQYYLYHYWLIYNSHGIGGGHSATRSPSVTDPHHYNFLCSGPPIQCIFHCDLVILYVRGVTTPVEPLCVKDVIVLPLWDIVGQDIVRLGWENHGAKNNSIFTALATISNIGQFFSSPLLQFTNFFVWLVNICEWILFEQ